MELHDGVVEEKSFVENEKNEDVKPKVNCITRMIGMVEKVVQETELNIIFILDAYFSNQTSFSKAQEINNNFGSNKISLIMRGKRNSVGFKELKKVETSKKRGRPNIYGEKVKLIELFKNNADDFLEDRIRIYGKDENIKYLCLYLLWKPIMRVVRFVLVEVNGNKIILMSNDLEISPIDVIVAYSYRFKIEVSFKMLKHTIGGFFCHFWTKATPKILKSKTKTDYRKVNDKKDQIKILETIKAIEVFTFISCMVLGILMIIAINHPQEVWNKFTGWLRTKSTLLPSPDTVKNVLQKELIWNYNKVSNYAIFQKMKKYENKYFEKIYELSP